MWAKFLNIFLGLWVMVAPGILGYSSAAADNGHIVGPIIVTFSVISLWEATHVLRQWNYPFAIWLLFAPWVLGYDDALAIGSDMLAGMLVIIFSSVKQNTKNQYGGGWASLLKENPDHAQERYDET